MIAPEILRTLRAIDWDFASPRAGYVAPPHWYPGTFVPALSDALIEALSPVGGRVFDPYSGIGTTGWSAIRTGRCCELADVNPIAVMVSYGSNALLGLSLSEPDKARLALSELARIGANNEDLLLTETISKSRGEDLDRAVYGVSKPSADCLLNELVKGPPNWEALAPWFASETLNHVMRLASAINAHESAFVRLLGHCMLSATARSLSSQHASWGHIADNVKPKELRKQNVRAAVNRWIKRALSFIRGPAAYPSYNQISDLVEVHQNDWSQIGHLGAYNSDLLLTSPPYADAIDYILSQRLSLYLMGYSESDILRLVSTEIGARRKRFKSISRSEWSAQLCSGLRDQVTWLKPSAIICLVLPHKDTGRSNGEEDIKMALTDMGWISFFERDRSIHQSHTRQSWTSIKQETIIAFRKESQC